MFAKVEDGAVRGTTAKPANTKSISWGANPDAVSLLKAGYYPLEDVDVEYNRDTQDRSGPVYEVFADKVTATYTVTDRPLDAVKAEAKAKVGKHAAPLLDALDRAAIRPLRAAIAGTETADDTARLSTIETEATTVRFNMVAHNEAIDALTTADDVVAYDSTTGWTT